MLNTSVTKQEELTLKVEKENNIFLSLSLKTDQGEQS